ncbi:hypothetical protein SISSUDRAFT_1054867 [Sistotremastrum suecicum HHB10207 ss-3]|uniref:Uncharacterized protein n=1 Tax=Sistotremastrum suecicum HHB10207 ss-3 TaxID=1314776 RepID=A0A165Y736_9AGAM|nr:hypothetical protein SISSUDRAFT_1054867 [Sistotremastrum suecicum HHB10207 ss-3]
MTGLSFTTVTKPPLLSRHCHMLQYPHPQCSNFGFTQLNCPAHNRRVLLLMYDRQTLECASEGLFQRLDFMHMARTSYR